MLDEVADFPGPTDGTDQQPQQPHQQNSEHMRRTTAEGIPLFGELSNPLSSHKASKVTKSIEKSNNDIRVMRRIIAEDPTYNLDTVLPLTDLCLKQCIENFECTLGFVHVNNWLRLILM